MLRERGELIGELLRELRPLVLNSARVVEAGARPVGLGVGTRAVLELLADFGPATVPALAARLDLARQGVQRHVDDLIKLGYATSTPNPAHRRSVLIAMTRTGQSVFAGLRAAERERIARLAPDCGAAEIDIALAVVRAVGRDVRRAARDV